MGQRQAIAIGDKVAVAGNGVRWLVVDFEGPHIVCARPFDFRGRAALESHFHPSALVVLKHAR